MTTSTPYDARLGHHPTVNLCAVARCTQRPTGVNTLKVGPVVKEVLVCERHLRGTS